MKLPNGYEMITTFPMDFSIADRFGIGAIQDTFNRAFKEWKRDYVYLTELTLTLNFKEWEWADKDYMVCKTYGDLFSKAWDYAVDHLKGDELDFFYKVTTC